MQKTDNLYITKEGLENLKAELKELIEVKRPEVAKRILSARENGDISENSEFDSAKQEQMNVENHIAELEEVIRNAKIREGGTTDKVDLGCKVTVHIDGDEDTFHIVGPPEANPLSGKISHESPLGQALYGKKIGDKIEVEAPMGKLIYTIKNIEY